MVKDPAGFDFEALSRIWGNPARSVLSGLREIQFHHIKGRGGKHERELHSSVFNAVPLTANEHAAGCVNHPELQDFFLRIAKEKIFFAIARDYYSLTSIDEEYLMKYQI